MRSPRPLSVAICLAVAAPLAFSAGPASAAPVLAKPYDFNGDGYPELVVGASSMRSRGEADGGIAVFRSSDAGLSRKARIFNPETLGLPRDNLERFGAAFASGDFNGDGYADLAVTRPVATKRYAGAGAVTLLYGSKTGLSDARSEELLQPGGPTDDARFGSSIAAADFDGDGISDLAVGAAYAEPSPDPGEGTVSIFKGGPRGLSADRSTVRRGERTGPDYDGYFGIALGVGDLDADGKPDLVVGSLETGSVSACYGSEELVTSCNRLARDEALDGFDRSLPIAVGNVSGTWEPEIVLGPPSFDKRGGTVQILSLSGPRGATTAVRTELTQASPGVPGNPEEGDGFGQALALGDLDDDGYDDLVIGAPGEDEEKGRVTVVYGGETKFRSGPIYDQDSKRVPGQAEKKDAFGTAVALVDHDADDHLDLTVGAPGENRFTGAVTLLRGSGDAFTTKRARTVTLKDLKYAAPYQATFGDALGR